MRGKQRSRPRFRTIDHTADVGLVVWGEDLPTLFENSAAGMFHLLYPGRRGGSSGRRIDFELVDRQLEELLVAWLRELLYVHDTERLYMSDFEVGLGQGPRLTATCYGRTIDPEKQLYEIKLVTYHGLTIERIDRLYRVRVIFDI